ncbi:MAG: hypothetical protein V4623_04675 [Pseudomonadota bacterium]
MLGNILSRTSSLDSSASHSGATPAAEGSSVHTASEATLEAFVQVLDPGYGVLEAANVQIERVEYQFKSTQEILTRVLTNAGFTDEQAAQASQRLIAQHSLPTDFSRKFPAAAFEGAALSPENSLEKIVAPIIEQLLCVFTRADAGHATTLDAVVPIQQTLAEHEITALMSQPGDFLEVSDISPEIAEMGSPQAKNGVPLIQALIAQKNYLSAYQVVLQNRQLSETSNLQTLLELEATGIAQGEKPLFVALLLGLHQQGHRAEANALIEILKPHLHNFTRFALAGLYSMIDVTKRQAAGILQHDRAGLSLHDYSTFARSFAPLINALTQAGEPLLATELFVQLSYRPSAQTPSKMDGKMFTALMNLQSLTLGGHSCFDIFVRFGDGKGKTEAEKTRLEAALFAIRAMKAELSSDRSYRYVPKRLAASIVPVSTKSFPPLKRAAYGLVAKPASGQLDNLDDLSSDYQKHCLAVLEKKPEFRVQLEQKTHFYSLNALCIRLPTWQPDERLDIALRNHQGAGGHMALNYDLSEESPLTSARENLKALIAKLSAETTQAQHAHSSPPA